MGLIWVGFDDDDVWVEFDVMILVAVLSDQSKKSLYDAGVLDLADDIDDDNEVRIFFP